MSQQHAQAQDDVLDLRDYIKVLRRRMWLILAVVVLVVAAALAFSFTQEPVYASSARVVVDPNSGRDDALSVAIFGNRELETQRELATSQGVAARTAALLGDGRDSDDLQRAISVTLLNDTQILQFRATGDSPDQAANTAQAFATAYLNYRTDQALENVLRTQDALDSRRAPVQERLAEIERELLLASPAEERSLELEQEQLAQELATLATQESSLNGNEVFAAAGGQIIQDAEPNRSPVAPRPIRTGILALVLGLMLGVGLAFLRDFLDDVIRTEEDAERATGHAVIGRIPKADAEEDGRLVMVADPMASAAEGYRALRSNLRYLTMNAENQAILITSAVPAEGKTTIACNLAIAMANNGKRVVLVGADMRKPTVRKRFGITSSAGLSELVIGETTLIDALVDVGIKNLRVLPAGSIPPNPAELLASASMIRRMAELSAVADVVIYDGPPILAVADAMELCAHVSSVVLVVNAGSSKRGAVSHAVQRLEEIDAPLSGIAVNRIGQSDGDYYYYYQYYGSEDPESDPPVKDPEKPAERSRTEPFTSA